MPTTARSVRLSIQLLTFSENISRTVSIVLRRARRRINFSETVRSFLPVERERLKFHRLYKISRVRCLRNLSLPLRPLYRPFFLRRIVPVNLSSPCESDRFSRSNLSLLFPLSRSTRTRSTASTSRSRSESIRLRCFSKLYSSTGLKFQAVTFPPLTTSSRRPTSVSKNLPTSLDSRLAYKTTKPRAFVAPRTTGDANTYHSKTFLSPPSLARAIAPSARRPIPAVSVTPVLD